MPWVPIRLDVKWSDGAPHRRSAWTPLLSFAKANRLDVVHLTCRTQAERHGAVHPTCVVWQHALLCFQFARLAASEASVLSRYGLPGRVPA